MENQNNSIKTILIVEDDNSLRLAMVTKFSQAGYNILEACDGAEGLVVAKQKHPHLIVLDIAMPKMDGISLLDNIRLDPWGQSVPVIILSNLDASDERITKVVTDHPAYYLIKTNTTLEEMLEKIQELLN